jgi:CelD/BcsL family acetyltransferase involved in cellulose biosynthesis
VAGAVACALRDDPDDAWDAIDLRRLRRDDPALDALVEAFRALAGEWQVEVAQEDVCPVVTLPGGGDWEAYLATLDKKARHEIRRKLRRAEAVGPVEFRALPLDGASVESFIALHQARWGAQGLFPDTPDGDRSRRFLHRLTSLEAAEGERAQLLLGEVSVGDQVVFSTASFDDGRTCFFYNAGMDPAARELSPGVTGTAAFLRDRVEAGRQRFDFLRGDEPYKYEWGAVDEPIERIVVRR